MGEIQGASADDETTDKGIEDGSTLRTAAVDRESPENGNEADGNEGEGGDGNVNGRGDNEGIIQ